MKKIIGILLALLFIPSIAGASLYNYYKDKNLTLPSIGERAITAAEFGIWHYVGDADQNNKLEAILKSLDTEEGQFGYSVVSRYRTRLSSSMTSSQTTVPVASLETFDGHTLTMTDLGNVVFLTIEPGTDREEIVKCTTISSTSWATCTRGLAFYGTTETAVAANQKAHNAGSIVVMSNVHYVYEQLPDKDTNQTLTGLWTFNQYPVFSNGATVPTSSAQFATKYYVDTVGAGGFTSLNASTTKGLATYGTSPETVGINASSTKGMTFDANGALYQVTSSTKGISSDTNGLYIDTSDSLTWTGDQTFSTTTMATSTITDLTASNLTVTNLSGATKLSKSFTAGENITAGNAVIMGDGVEDAVVITQDAQDADYTLNATTKQLAQSFTTDVYTTKIVSVEIYVASQAGAEGNGIVNIYAVSGDSPTGGSLGSKTIARPDTAVGYNTFTFASPIAVSASTKYVIVLSDSISDGGNYNVWDYKDVSAYSGGKAQVSTDSGGSWATLGTSGDLRFKVNFLEKDTITGRIYKADASTADRFANNFIGFADSNITSGLTGNINLVGIDDNQTGLSAGLTYYLSDTSGAISSSAGSTSRKIGIALSATEILIKHDNP